MFFLKNFVRLQSFKKQIDLFLTNKIRGVAETAVSALLLLCILTCENIKQDGWLAPAYFSPNYKCIDRVLQTVKNKTTVLILVFKEFLQTSIRPLISVLYAKEYHDFPWKNFCVTVPKSFVEEPVCVSENFWYRKTLGLRGEYHDFL